MKKAILLLMVILLTISCGGEGEESVDHREGAYADVFIKHVLNPKGNDMYGVALRAAGVNATKITVTTPSNEEITMSKSWKGAGNFESIPCGEKPGTMKMEKPKAGKYVFKLEFSDGKTIELEDELTDDEIPAIKKLNVSSNEEGTEFKLDWDKVEGATCYIVKIMSKEKEKVKPYFVKKCIKDTSFTITENEKSWIQGGIAANKPAKKEEIYFAVVAVMAEKEAKNIDTNKQMVSPKGYYHKAGWGSKIVEAEK